MYIQVFVVLRKKIFQNKHGSIHVRQESTFFFIKPLLEKRHFTCLHQELSCGGGMWRRQRLCGHLEEVTQVLTQLLSHLESAASSFVVCMGVFGNGNYRWVQSLMC